ncbi:MAG: hypothetical protein Q8O33_07275 [Pseudomonadota bacterium]|nr:hypothetical protein [Pseudomonadota bacterium]
MSQSKPRCFTSRRQFDLWVEAAQRIHPGGSSFCTDCSPEYQQRMVALHRCAYPATSFHFDADGYVEGRRPVEDRIKRREVA